MNNPYEEKLRQFADDEVLFHAVMNVLAAKFDLNIQLKDTVLNNQQLMEMVRGCIDGLERLKSGFKELEKYRTPAAPSRDAKNPNQV